MVTTMKTRVIELRKRNENVCQSVRRKLSLGL